MDSPSDLSEYGSDDFPDDVKGRHYELRPTTTRDQASDHA
jgi:hypothetical protein